MPQARKQKSQWNSMGAVQIMGALGFDKAKDDDFSAFEAFAKNKGFSTDKITALQVLFNKMIDFGHIHQPKIEVDGTYGPKTLNALKYIRGWARKNLSKKGQETSELFVDGIDYSQYIRDAISLPQLMPNSRIKQAGFANREDMIERFLEYARMLKESGQLTMRNIDDLLTYFALGMQTHGTFNFKDEEKGSTIASAFNKVFGRLGYRVNKRPRTIIPSKTVQKLEIVEEPELIKKLKQGEEISLKDLQKHTDTDIMSAIDSAPKESKTPFWQYIPIVGELINLFLKGKSGNMEWQGSLINCIPILGWFENLMQSPWIQKPQELRLQTTILDNPMEIFLKNRNGEWFVRTKPF
ncbi:hypothetical protein KJ780_03440 [Candidatus Micrarchaeota archaeon]|nr:hypothetical protein [Candidatus Micrarchaeota archaeon]